MSSTAPQMLCYRKKGDALWSRWHEPVVEGEKGASEAQGQRVTGPSWVGPLSGDTGAGPSMGQHSVAFSLIASQRGRSSVYPSRLSACMSPPLSSPPRLPRSPFATLGFSYPGSDVRGLDKISAL